MLGIVSRINDERLTGEERSLSCWRSHPQSMSLHSATDIAKIIYTIILLKSVTVRKLQVAILGRSSQEMSQTIEWQYILSRVHVSVRPSHFSIRKKHPKAIAKTRVSRHFLAQRRKCLLNAPVTFGRSIASDNMSGDNSDHGGEILNQNGKKATSQNVDNESLYLHDLKMWFRGNSVVTDVQFGHLFLVCIKYVALQEVTCGLFKKISHCS